ncbi:MAG: hypothetical protein JNK82_03710 [Myxococcaceae bacterium]|nr:hypothetical protein [Myxococcaceae bacterium]
MLLLVAVLLAQPNVTYGHFKEYDARLRAQLGIPPLAAEAKRADFVFRAVVLPSFHPECFVSVVRAKAKAEMVVRCASGSIWHAAAAKRPEPKTVMDWFELSADEVRSLEAIGDEVRSWSEKHEDDGVDGMSTTFEVSSGKSSRAVEVWHRGGKPNAWVNVLAALIQKHGKNTTPMVAAWAVYLDAR